MRRFISVPVVYDNGIVNERINVDLITSYGANIVDGEEKTWIEIGGKRKVIKMPIDKFEEEANNEILNIKLGV